MIGFAAGISARIVPTDIGLFECGAWPSHKYLYTSWRPESAHAAQ